MVRKLYIVIIITLIDLPLFCQLENIPLVTVYGESSLQVMPDQVLLSIQVENNMSVQEVKTLSKFDIFDKATLQLKFLNVDNEEITESIINIQNDKERVIFIKEIVIEINDVSKYPDILIKLYRLDLKKIQTIDFRVTNLPQLKEDTREQAISQAQEKARGLAVKLGQNIGKAHLVEELESKVYSWYANNDFDRQDVLDVYKVFPGYITIYSRVKVSFDLLK